MPRRLLTGAALLAGLAVLYLTGLDRVGLLLPDEPRYAAIGQAMAQTGDWITPKLWGQPWFEKPALLYWMIALGFRMGGNDEWAPRLPVALLSVAFLVFYYWRLRRLFGPLAAGYAAVILATSAFWLAFSHIAVTDLPLAATFSIAMLLVFPADDAKPAWAGVFLGLAILAKGLVPLILFLPALFFLRQRLRNCVITAIVAAVVAVPWYVLVTIDNGTAFLTEFFWRQHFQRFGTPALQHVQPFWFYVPVLLAAMFPWTPLLLLPRREVLRETTFFAAWLLWGLVFFTASRNKLPGYLLPLLPALAVILGLALAKTVKPTIALTLCAMLTALLPLVMALLPAALEQGISHVHVQPAAYLWPLVAGSGVVAFFLANKGYVRTTLALIGTGVVSGVLALVLFLYPVLDRQVSARDFSRNHPDINCLSFGSRSWRYGINYYFGRVIPDCN